MRHFNMLAAVAVALLAGGVATAEEKPVKPKAKKICRVVEDSGSRMAVQRVCKVVDSEPVRAKPQQEAARQPSEATNQTD